MGTVTDLGVTTKPAPKFHRFFIRMADGQRVSYVGCSYAIGYSDEGDLVILDVDGTTILVHFLPHAAMSIEGRPISATEYRRGRKRRVTWDAD